MGGRSTTVCSGLYKNWFSLEAVPDWEARYLYLGRYPSAPHDEGWGTPKRHSVGTLVFFTTAVWSSTSWGNLRDWWTTSRVLHDVMAMGMQRD